IKWKAPVFIASEPDSDWLLVVQQGGEKEKPSKILRVRDDPNADDAETFLELDGRLIYSVTFHPGYKTNGQLYVFSHGVTGTMARTNFVSRFIVQREEPRQCDTNSEQVIIQWHSEGHDGG